MSRIQNILEKAERDGAMRRVRTAEPLQPQPSVIASLDPADTLGAGAPLATASALPVDLAGEMPLGVTELTEAGELGASAAGAVRIEGGGQVIQATFLDRRLVAASANSAAAEQYRALRTRILHTDNGAAVNVLLITSPGRGEGKTITAGNLALTMAQDYQRRICLVDADLRNPQIHRLFGLPEGPGLCDVLAGRATLDQALITIEEHQLTLLPAGRAPARPAELLGTTAMRRTLDTLRSRFDRVVVDAPAAAPLADVGILTPLVDSVLLVVRSAVTSKPAIHDAVASIDGAKLLGVVLNDAIQG